MLARFKAASADDRIDVAGESLRPGDFAWGLAPNAVRCVSLVVRYNGTDRHVWIHQSVVRDGWLSDTINAVVRRLTGSKTGTCRTRAGADVVEFRDRWPVPSAVAVSERVPIVVTKADGVEVKDTFVCQASIMPGGDVESLILASCYQKCSRRFGHGDIWWDRAASSHIRYRANGLSTFDSSIPMRYTVHRSGRSTEVIIRLPFGRHDRWDSVFAAVEMECRSRFGVGELSYESELGECHFSYR